MTITIPYTMGETKTWRARLQNDVGGIADLTGAPVSLRLSTPGGCLIVPGAIDPDPARGVGFRLSADTLGPGPRSCSGDLWVHWPDGEARAYAHVHLIVTEGCGHA